LSGKDQVLEETVTHIPLWGSTDLTALACWSIYIFSAGDQNSLVACKQWPRPRRDECSVSSSCSCYMLTYGMNLDICFQSVAICYCIQSRAGILAKFPLAGNLNKVLSHWLAKCGPISPLTVRWIWTFSTLLVNGWRSHCLAQSADYMLEPKCITHQRYLHNDSSLKGHTRNFWWYYLRLWNCQCHWLEWCPCPLQKGHLHSSISNLIGNYFGVTIKKPKGNSKEVGWRYGMDMFLHNRSWKSYWNHSGKD
jgi:hypothetical protein